MSFENKIAIVTGGASGIGRALCQELAQRGARVVVADINAPVAHQVASALTAAHQQAVSACVDVSQEQSVQTLVHETVAQYGRLDYMFNNAGIGLVADLRDMTLEHWRRIVDINLWGVIYGTTAAYHIMLQQGAGHIVNTASAAGLFPSAALGTAYTATKHAVVGLATAFRPEAAQFGVKVSVVCPGIVNTGIFDAMTCINVERQQMRALMSAVGLIEPAQCARVILRGVSRNQAIILVTWQARVMWWLYRISPALYSLLMRRAAREAGILRRSP
jgi:NAD(P)-dependent dehydrogenase (short-subunit alcohol dehydrogenase family)